MEVRDQEVTLDDLYTLNLSKLDEWKCIIPVCYALICLCALCLTCLINLYLKILTIK